MNIIHVQDCERDILIQRRATSHSFWWNFVSRKFRETGYETIFVFRENERRNSRVSQFRETAEITKETSFAKHENRENEENLK